MSSFYGCSRDYEPLDPESDAPKASASTSFAPAEPPLQASPMTIQTEMGEHEGFFSEVSITDTGMVFEGNILSLTENTIRLSGQKQFCLLDEASPGYVIEDQEGTIFTFSIDRLDQGNLAGIMIQNQDTLTFLTGGVDFSGFSLQNGKVEDFDLFQSCPYNDQNPDSLEGAMILTAFVAVVGITFCAIRYYGTMEECLGAADNGCIVNFDGGLCGGDCSVDCTGL
mgnify:FL=1